MKWLLPPWLSVPLKLAGNFLRAVPWQIWATIAVVAAIWLTKTVSFNAGVDVTNAEWQARFDRANAEADRKAREAEQAHVNEVDRIAQNLIEERNRGFQERDQVIADLRAGALRLRPRFQCPARQQAAPAGTAAAGSDGGAQAGLSGADAEFLVREASRADEVARQLTACQAVIRADRALVNDGQ